jgi:hypothetical protein
MINTSTKDIQFLQSPTWKRSALVSTYSAFFDYNIECCATDCFSSSVIKSMGELSERLCLYSLQGVEKRTYTPSTFSTSGFQFDFQEPRKLPSSFELDMVFAENLISGESVLIPLSLLSFHPDTHGYDIYPYSDTTGCAVHTNLENSFKNALMEFCERQAFFGCFFGSLPILDLPSHEEFKEFKRQLPNSYKNGRLLTMDLGSAFGCHVIFTLLLNNDSNACQVVTGLGSHLNRNLAIQKSFEELLQILRLSHHKVFIENDSEYLAATQHAAFEKFLSKQRLPCMIDADYDEGTIDSALKNISKISRRLWLYSAIRVIDGRNYVFCKVLSPDFYIFSKWQHRNINHPFEKFANSYSNIANETCPVFV